MIGVKINPYAGVYKRAVELYETGYYNEAYEKFNVIIRNDYDNYMANYFIAECYFLGRGVEKNYEAAFQNYSISAHKRHIESVYKLGYCYEMGLGTHVDEIQMILRYTQAAKSGHSLSQYRLGLCYKNGFGVEQNYNIASTYFLNAAKKGLVQAQREAGICFEIINQPTASATLFLAAAEQKDPYSCYKIATFYEKGYGCEPKLELAMHFYITASTLGNEDAILAIADKYKLGTGVNKSLQSAINWWSKILDKNPIAQYEVGVCYYSGNGLEKDINKGLALLNKSANSGNASACIELAKHALGLNTDESNKEYVKWLVKAASLNNVEAMYLLGIHYENNQQIKECYRWYSLAVNHDHELAKQAIKKYKKTIFGSVKVK